jgi:two-component system NarL family sensor kinase
VFERRAVAELTENAEVYSILVRHAFRGLRVQFVLRFVLVAFMIAVIAAVPPAKDSAACYLIVAAYALWTIWLGLWAGHGGVALVRWIWLALVVDALALAVLTWVAGASAEQSWTADLLVNGFFIIPMLAATQLRPLICVAISVPTTAAYFASSVATKAANTEPWGSIILRTAVLAGLGVGCVALSGVQLSRVLTIARLAQERTELLNELIDIEARERTALAEQLHDGVLQYVLAARHDLEDARDQADPAAFDRLDRALNESSGLLRATVSQLHPAVLDQAGLARALQDLASETARRSGFELDIDVEQWPEGRRSEDRLLYSCARELLTNVAKHAQAGKVRVELARTEHGSSLTITDDGEGLPPDARTTRLAEGHIGLASLATRVAAAGGRLTIESVPGAGTSAAVVLPPLRGNGNPAGQ